jgi:hypothetical protein
MKTHKNVAKLKYIKINQQKSQSLANNPIFDKEELDTKTTVEINEPSYKKFEDEEESTSQDSKKPTANFKLPKFLVEKEDQKQKIENFKQEPTIKSAGNLPFTPENFESNPNSFTSIFNKDNEKINGFQRVFRKSIFFLVIQLVLFTLISTLALTGFGLSFGSLIGTGISVVIFISLIIAYTAVTSIFFIIVADRSYIWISILLQALVTVALYSFVGLGFSIPTLVFSVVIMTLSYFAYLEIEKVQVSTRFFSISYVTNEAIKILSTVAILTLCLGVFQSVSSQTPKNFITKNLIDNSFIYKLLVDNGSGFGLNKFAVNGQFPIDKDSKSVLIAEGETKKIATVNDFLDKNTPTLDQKSSCLPTDTTCLAQIPSKDKKISEYLTKIQEQYNVATPLKPTDQLTESNYKNLLKYFYADKIVEFETQKNLQNIPYIGNFQPLAENARTLFIPAIIALAIYVILTLVKFVIHFLVSIIVWIIWKFLILIRFVKIDIELVESEIVSI